MRLTKFILPMALIFSTGANANLTIASYLQYKNSPEPAVRNVAMNYLAGVNGAVLAMNELMFIRTKYYVYCQPRKLALDTTQLKTMIDSFLKENPNIDKQTPIEMVAIDALEYTFPCTQ